jgi:Flp pilus assembly protein TadG
MNWLRKFWQDCHGGLSPSIAIIMMYLITVCGMGANAAYLMTPKMRLEGVADVIALEAMRGIRDTNRDLNGVRSYALNNARDAAGDGSIDINLLRDVTTIQFGWFDQKTMKFTEDEGNPEAVVVTLDFTADTGHPVRRMYYTTAGRFADMSVRRVAQFYTPRCYTSGIVAQGKLEFRGNLSMQGDYCLRSNKQIAINSSWSLGNDGIISVPPNSNLPQSVVDKHEDTGVLEYRHWKMQVSKNFNGFYKALTQEEQEGFNFHYLHNSNMIKVNIPRIGKRKPWRHASPSDYYVGRVNYTGCWNKDTLVLNGGTYQNMLLVTNCRIDITSSVRFNNMTLITTKGGKDSIEARQGLHLGNRSTACSSNTGTVFMTRGGISAPNAIKLYGAQLITYADDAHNKGSLPTTVLGGPVEMIGSSIFSGGHMRFNKSAKYTDCPNPTSRGMVKNDYIRMGVY